MTPPRLNNIVMTPLDNVTMSLAPMSQSCNPNPFDVQQTIYSPNENQFTVSPMKFDSSLHDDSANDDGHNSISSLHLVTKLLEKRCVKTLHKAKSQQKPFLPLIDQVDAIIKMLRKENENRSKYYERNTTETIQSKLTLFELLKESLLKVLISIQDP